MFQLKRWQGLTRGYVFIPFDFSHARGAYRLNFVLAGVGLAEWNR